MIGVSSSCTRSESLYKELGDTWSVAYVLADLTNPLYILGDYSRARTSAQESLTLFKKLGDKRGIAYGLRRLGEALLMQGDVIGAHRRFDEALALFKEVGDRYDMARSLYFLAEIYLYEDNIPEAHTHAEKSLALFREIGVPWSVNPLMTLARVAITQGKNAVANALYEEIWPIARTMHTKNLLVYCLMGFGEVVAAQEQVAWAVRLWSVAETLLETIQMPLPPLDQTLFDRFIAAARTQLGEAVFAGVWAEGRDMTLEQVLAAREPAAIPREVSPVPASTTTPASSVPLYPAGLTAREVEVLRLVAQGLTNAQIAEQLIISPYTVNAHMRSIYSKLDVTSRIAVMQYATRHHLI